MVFSGFGVGFFQSFLELLSCFWIFDACTVIVLIVMDEEATLRTVIIVYSKGFVGFH